MDGKEMCRLRRSVQFAVLGGQTKRFHTCNTIGENSVAAHSFQVAWLCHVLMQGASYNLIMAAIAHDMAEQTTGDLPGHIKLQLPSGQELEDMEHRALVQRDWNFVLNADEQFILKLADYLSGMLFCCQERMMGNKSLNGCFSWWNERVMDMVYGLQSVFSPNEVIRIVVNEVQQHWLEAIR